MTNDDVPNPGSDEAIELGCACPVLENAHGREGTLSRIRGWIIRVGCPVHFPEVNP